MLRVLVDTNVLVRFVIGDDAIKHKEVEVFFRQIAKGEVVPYLSSVVLMEMIFVLKSFYNKDMREILAVVKKLARMRGVVPVDKTDLQLALVYMDKYKVKFSDCLIASSVPKGVKVFSYDRDFEKMKLDFFDLKRDLR